MSRLLPLPMVFLILASAHAGEDGFTPLLKKDLAGWKAVPETAKDTFTTQEEGDLILRVSGKPLAYLHTEKTYRDYTLRYEWKSAKEGQSGLLLHIATPHKIWPRCIQAQARDRDHGRLFAMGGAAGRFTRDGAAQLKVVKEGDWNETEVASKNGKLTVRINGTEVSSGDSELKEGPIGFQSEGTEFFFRNVRIKE